MKKIYKQPSIEWLSIEEEQMVCESIPMDKKALNRYSMDSKERNNVDFSSDSDWDF